MINPDLLADADRCPECAASVVGWSRCERCGLPLTGPIAAELWAVSRSAADLLRRRANLLMRLRASAVAEPPQPTTSAPARPARPRTEWSRERVGNLLLALGSLLVATAAVIFVAVSWGRLGIGGKAAVMAAVTILSAVGAHAAHRRQLAATAEAVGMLAVVLSVLDTYALRRTDLLGPHDALHYWAAATAIVAALATIGAVDTPIRTYRLAAATLGQLPLLILAVRFADVPQPWFVSGSILGVQVLALVLVLNLLRARPAVRDACWILTLSAPVTWAIAVLFAIVQAFPDLELVFYPDDAALGIGLLVGLAVPAWLTAWLWRHLAYVRHLSVAAGTVTVFLAGWAPIHDPLPSSWEPAVLSPVAGLAGLVLAGLLILVVVPPAWRLGAAVVLAVAGALAALAVAVASLTAVLGPFGWVSEFAWTGDPARLARDVISPDNGLERPGGLELVVAAAVLAVAAAAAGWVTGRRSLFAALAIGPLAVAVLTAPLATQLTYPFALGWDLVAALLFAVVGWRLRRPDQRLLRRSLAGAAGALAAVSLAWSAAVAEATLTVVGVALLCSIGVLWKGSAGARVLATVLTIAFAGGETAAITAYAGADVTTVGLVLALLGSAVLGTAAVAARGQPGLAAEATAGLLYPLGLGLARPDLDALVPALAAGILATGIAAWRSRTALRDGWTAAAPALVATEAVVASQWLGAEPAQAALALAVTAAALVPFGTWMAGRYVARPDAIEVVGAVAGALALAGLVDDPDGLWLGLLATGVGGALSVLHPKRRRLAAAPTLLLLASSWVRLALAGVTAIEAYTVPAGLLLLLAGWYRTRHATLGSWAAYGSGLALILAPSLLVAMSDPGLTRPLLLGAVSLGILLAGARRRLKAPLVLGGATLAVDAVVQLSPYLAATYAALPRWVVIGAAGLLLLGLGATYERRVRDLKRLRQTIGELR